MLSQYTEHSENNKYTMKDLYKEFYKLMFHYNIIKDEDIICRDFNIHGNKSNYPDTKKVVAILSRFNITQHVNELTHRLGNTLNADKGRTINHLVVLVDYYNEELCNILDKEVPEEHSLVLGSLLYEFQKTSSLKKKT